MIRHSILADFQTNKNFIALTKQLLCETNRATRQVKAKNSTKLLKTSISIKSFASYYNILLMFDKLIPIYKLSLIMSD